MSARISELKPCEESLPTVISAFGTPRAYRNAPCRSKQGAKQFARQRTIVVDQGVGEQFRQVSAYGSTFENVTLPGNRARKTLFIPPSVRCRLGRLVRCLRAIARIRARRCVVSPSLNGRRTAARAARSFLSRRCLRKSQTIAQQSILAVQTVVVA